MSISGAEGLKKCVPAEGLKMRTFYTWLDQQWDTLKNLMQKSVLVSFPHAHTYPD